MYQLLKVLLTVYFSILFLILLYDQFYYEKCHYLALIEGGRLCGGGALRSVNIQRTVWFPLAPPPPPIFSTLTPPNVLNLAPPPAPQYAKPSYAYDQISSSCLQLQSLDCQTRSVCARPYCIFTHLHVPLLLPKTTYAA